jgi:hypothetical protein
MTVVVVTAAAAAVVVTFVGIINVFTSSSAF